MEIIITCSVIFFMAFTFFLKQSKVNKSKKLQQLGLVYIGQIKKVITLVQQHRGLTAAWLNGDNKVQTKLVVLKQQISQEMKTLEDSIVSKNERWSGFVDHWQRLLQLNNKPSVANSFEQHTMMIRNLAYLLEDTAEKSHLTADYLPELKNIGYVWRELVLATESIGQSRALGTGIAAQQFCSSVDKIRLNFLMQTMIKITEHTLQRLSYLPDEKYKHTELVRKATEKMNQLIQVISHELVNARKINIDNNSYFDLATETMKQMNDIFEHQVKQLNTSL